MQPSARGRLRGMRIHMRIDPDEAKGSAGGDGAGDAFPAADGARVIATKDERQLLAGNKRPGMCREAFRDGQNDADGIVPGLRRDGGAPGCVYARAPQVAN